MIYNSVSSSELEQNSAVVQSLRVEETSSKVKCFIYLFFSKIGGLGYCCSLDFWKISHEADQNILNSFFCLKSSKNGSKTIFDTPDLLFLKSKN